MGLLRITEPHFELAGSRGRSLSAFAASFGVQIVVLTLLALATRAAVKPAGRELAASISNLVFVHQDGPGGGGGGGGNRNPLPPRRAEIPQPTSTIVAPLREASIDPAELPRFNIPITTLATVEVPGAIGAPAGPSTSQGLGTGGGADGPGVGVGIGIGDGPGLGPGRGGNTGGDSYAPGTGGRDPVPIFQAEPAYTPAAVTARVTGEVWVECTVTSSGACVNARVVRSLDQRFGLDQEAVRTAERWRFTPGTDKQGRPVPFRVVIGVAFRIR